MFDFAENYAYAVQDASQGFHFNNDQATVFPVMYYYREGEEVKHQSSIFISDSRKHDTASVYTVQTQLIPMIKKKIPRLKKIFYFTDGAKQHFKNKYSMINLLKHKEDFSLEAEWHFSATAHGKCVCDGLGATFKKEAYKASLKADPTKPILNLKSLHTWAVKFFKEMKIFAYTKVEHDLYKEYLSERFKAAIQVPEISKNHSFTILENNKLKIKKISSSNTAKIINMVKKI